MPPKTNFNKKKEEALATEIKKLRKKKENMQCCDCGARATPYVCSTFNSFICADCSGIHRKYGHRVKSIAMTTFKEEEVKNLHEGGNELCNLHYLAKYKKGKEMMVLPIDPTDRDKAELLIKMKYVDKKWYSDKIASKEKKKKKVKGDKKHRKDTATGDSLIENETTEPNNGGDLFDNNNNNPASSDAKTDDFGFGPSDTNMGGNSVTTQNLASAAVSTLPTQQPQKQASIDLMGDIFNDAPAQSQQTQPQKAQPQQQQQQQGGGDDWGFGSDDWGFGNQQQQQQPMQTAPAQNGMMQSSNMNTGGNDTFGFDMGGGNMNGNTMKNTAMNDDSMDMFTQAMQSQTQQQQPPQQQEVQKSEKKAEEPHVDLFGGLVMEYGLTNSNGNGNSVGNNQQQQQQQQPVSQQGNSGMYGGMQNGGGVYGQPQQGMFGQPLQQHVGQQMQPNMFGMPPQQQQQQVPGGGGGQNYMMQTQSNTNVFAMQQQQQPNMYVQNPYGNPMAMQGMYAQGQMQGQQNAFMMPNPQKNQFAPQGTGGGGGGGDEENPFRF